MAMRSETVEQLAPHDHVVQFYDDETSLVRAVGAYLTSALVADDIALVVATGPHRRGFEAEMAQAGVDISSVLASGQLICLDAAETLCKIMSGGSVSAASLDAEIGYLLVEALNLGKRVHVYGEMVALLWDDGDVVGAIALERAWNDLGQQLPFSLYCAYSAPSVSGPANSDAFQQVCHLHSQVVGPDPATDGPRVTTPAADPMERADRAEGCSFPATMQSPEAARRWVVAKLHAWGHPELAVDAALVVSELAANAVEHARSDFTVLLTRTSRSAIRIDVVDKSSALPRSLSPTPAMPAGRGLAVVAAVAQRWGAESTADGGKVVWAELGS